MSIDTNYYVTSECSRATVHSHTEVLMCLYLLYVLLNTAHQQAMPYFPDNTNCIVYYKRNKSVLNWLLKETNIISVIPHTAEPVTCYLTKKRCCSLSTFCLLILIGIADYKLHVGLCNTTCSLCSGCPKNITGTFYIYSLYHISMIYSNKFIILYSS